MNVQEREVAAGVTTTLTCIVSDLTERTEIKWYLDNNQEVENSLYNIEVEEDMSAEGTQRSTLEISGETESKLFTCRVSSTLYPDSPFSDTLAHLHVYGSTPSQSCLFHGQYSFRCLRY